jgi:hypothetical protein
MMENDDKLIRQFLRENRQEIADNGFSRRVRNRLPTREQRISNIWTACCSVVIIALFFLLNVGETMIEALGDIYLSLIENAEQNLDLRSLIIVGVVLLVLGIRKACSWA